MRKMIIGILIVVCSGYTALAQRHCCSRPVLTQEKKEKREYRDSKPYAEKEKSRYSFKMDEEETLPIEFDNEEGIRVVSYDFRETTKQMKRNGDGSITYFCKEKIIHICEDGMTHKEREETKRFKR